MGFIFWGVGGSCIIKYLEFTSKSLEELSFLIKHGFHLKFDEKVDNRMFADMIK